MRQAAGWLTYKDSYNICLQAQSGKKGWEYSILQVNGLAKVDGLSFANFDDHSIDIGWSWTIGPLDKKRKVEGREEISELKRFWKYSKKKNTKVQRFKIRKFMKTS